MVQSAFLKEFDRRKDLVDKNDMERPCVSLHAHLQRNRLQHT